MQCVVFIFVFYLLRQTFALTENLKNERIDDDFAQRIASAIQSLQSAAENEDKLQKTYCVVQCVQNMQSQQMQLPNVEVMDAQFGSWIDGPYNVFLFQAMCGTYVHHKDCLKGCPASEAKTATLKSFEPLDYTCVRHYDAFLTHLPCFMNLKKGLEKTCTDRCGGIENLIKEFEASKIPEKSIKNFFDDSLNKICSLSLCQRDCFEPIVQSTCGIDALSLVHHFTTMGAHEFLQELRSAGHKKFPENCIKLEDEPANSPVVVEIPSRKIVFDSNKTSVNVIIDDITKVPKKVVPYVEHEAFVKQVIPEIITSPPDSTKEINVLRHKHNGKHQFLVIFLTIFLSLLTVLLVFLTVITIVGKKCERSKEATYNYKPSKVRKAWVSVQGFISPKKFSPPGEVIAY